MQKYLNIRQQFTEDESKINRIILQFLYSSLFQARHYMKQILSGIEYLHSHQILHRDLKLHNLLLTKENNVVRTSFFTQITKIFPLYSSRK
jgi:serine/threonine protein kinase